MKRIIRERPLSTDEAAEDQALREQVATDLPELLASYHAQVRSRRILRELFSQLQAAQRSKGTSISALPLLTPQERFTLMEYEAGRPAILRLKTLRRYARAVGKRVVVTLADA